MITFDLGKDKLEYNDGINECVNIWKELVPIRERAVKKFIERYDSDKTIKLETLNDGKFYSSDAFLSFSQMFVERGVYDFDLKYLFKNKLYNEYIINYEEFVNELKLELKLLENGKNEAYARRELIKHNRFKVQGGGFGVAGAAKGIIAAETFNLVTGSVYSICNFILNSADDYRISSKKTKLYYTAKAPLINALKQDIDNLMLVLSSYFAKDISIDRALSNKIISNIDNGVIQKPYMKEALIKAILSDPFNEIPYKYLIYHYNELEDDVKSIADYFHIDLEDYLKVLHEVNGYYFKDISLVEDAKKELEKLNMKPVFFEKKFWEKQSAKKKILLNLILIFWQNMDKKRSNIEMTGFLEHCATFFQNIADGELLISSNKDEIDKCIKYYSEDALSEFCNIVRCQDKISEDAKKGILGYFNNGDTNGNIYLFINTAGNFSLDAFSCASGDKSLLLTQNEIIISCMHDGDITFKKILLNDFVKCCCNHNNTNVIEFYTTEDIEPVGYFDLKGNIDSNVNCECIAKCINDIAKNISPFYKFNEEWSSIINKNSGYMQDFSERFILGHKCEKEGNFEKAFSCYLLDAMEGYSWGSYKLGIYYGNSRYVSQDYSKAKYWFMKAANENNNYAIKYLKNYRIYFRKIKNINLSNVYLGSEFTSDFINNKLRIYYDKVYNDVIQEDVNTDGIVGGLEATATIIDLLF